MEQKIKIIGMGCCGTGISTVDYMVENADIAADYILFDTVILDSSSEAAKSKYQKDKTKIISKTKAPQIVLLDKHEAFSDTIYETVKEHSLIKTELADAERVILIIGLSDGGSAEIAKALVAALKNQGIKSSVFAVTPFKFEGQKIADRANTDIAEIKQFADEVTVISPDDIKKYTDKAVDFKNIYQTLNEVVCGMIKQTV